MDLSPSGACARGLAAPGQRHTTHLTSNGTASTTHPPASAHDPRTAHAEPDPSSSAPRSQQGQAAKHLVGGSRLTQRTASARALSRAASQSSIHPPTPSGTHVSFAPPLHARTASANAASASPSPRPQPPQVRRNASVLVAPRTSNLAALKRNASSGQLPRAASRSALAKKPVQAEASTEPPRPQPTVRFALGEDKNSDEEDSDDGWTEESASQGHNSPEATRRNSIAGGEAMRIAADMPSEPAEPAPPAPKRIVSDTPRLAPPLPNQSFLPRTVSADVLTSRLLSRTSSATYVAPQLSIVSATGVPLLHGSTLNHTPQTTDSYPPVPSGSSGRDLVSRFITPGTGSASTRSPHLSKTPPSRTNISPPPRQPKSPASSHPPGAALSLPPSRTQKKLLLQRASSNLEPPRQGVVPAILPSGRPGATKLLQAHQAQALAAKAYAQAQAQAQNGDDGAGGLGIVGMPGPVNAPGAGVGRPMAGGIVLGAGGLPGVNLPAQIRAVFEQAGRQYGVVRRFRDPLRDAVARMGVGEEDEGSRGSVYPSAVESRPGTAAEEEHEPLHRPGTLTAPQMQGRQQRRAPRYRYRRGRRGEEW
ncbi:hypothetical protein EJ06DRAFT_524440 [Trichodelitschia bisporula]|uniref:Uncharacterized protein n=1 Tax=Trichodelitschia bisporula TaxID=703511 RepID=A0A6G1HM53_9PEZI|nr:hypothetical protein EJ06DRAFT_524440 [Trichodelitschia bisporula]